MSTWFFRQSTQIPIDENLLRDDDEAENSSQDSFEDSSSQDNRNGDNELQQIG